MGLLAKTIKNIKEVQIDPQGLIRTRFQDLAIPKGSLGRLEELAILYSSIRGIIQGEVKNKIVFTMVGDHGVVEEGVSLFPQEVTRQMVRNFLEGGAAINILARHMGARVVVVDCGVAAPMEPAPGLKIKKVNYGTQNITQGPAMTPEEAVRSVEVGIEILEEELAAGIELVATGDMGIGNTTPSSAVLAALTGIDIQEVIGRGTGLDDHGLNRKAQVIKKALEVNRPDPRNPLDVLSKVGGYEIGAIAGLCLAAARHRLPVLLDGFISTAGALLAAEIEPKVKGYLIAAHLSTERGHPLMLKRLGKRPLFDLDLCLGEGTGAVLAMGLVEASVKLLTQMATFEEALVSKAQPPGSREYNLASDKGKN